ncbi:MAG TPA: hypothetical protein VII06_00650 [Chloroflexota bacterium]
MIERVQAMDELSPREWAASVTTDEFMCSSEFLNDGGKLIVLPRSMLQIWYGSTFPWTQNLNGEQGWRVAQSFHKLLRDHTDFAMAHRTRDWFDVIQLGRRQAVVLGYDYAEIDGRWLRTLPERQDYLLAIEYGDTGFERGVAIYVRQLSESSWQDLGLRFEVPDEDLLLFDTGTPGAWLQEIGANKCAVLGQGIPWRIPAGSYTLHQASADEAHGCAGHAEVCWLRPA